MPTLTNNVTGNENAIIGVSVDGRGIEGWSETQYGVAGESKKSAGVRGTSADGRGVEGWSTNSEGVLGISEKGRGVVGTSKTATAVEGTSVSGAGVRGTSQTNEGVHAETNSPTVAAIAAYNLNPSGTGAAIFAKKEGNQGHAGFFIGNVEITGNLTIQGISIQTWLHRIVQLEQQVADLLRQAAAQPNSGSGGSAGGTGTQTFIAATVSFNPSSSGVDGRILTVSGQGFKAGEGVNLKFVYRASQTDNPNPPYEVQTTANGMGVFYYKSAVSCGSDVTKRPSWQVIATGLSSGSQSNVVNVGC